jgi:hypothetical protein
MADKNGFSGSTFVAGAGDVDHLSDAVGRIHIFLLAGFVSLSNVHGPDLGRSGVCVTGIAVRRSRRMRNDHPLTVCGEWKISVRPARGVVSKIIIRS